MSIFPYTHDLISRITGDPVDKIETISAGRATVYADFDDECSAAVLPDTQLAIFYRVDEKLRVVVVMLDDFRSAAGKA